MHRETNPSYHRAPVPHPRYGPPPGTAPPFPGPFNSPNFPNLVSYPRPVPPPGYQNFSSETHYQTVASPAQFPAGWTLQEDELQNLEVKKKAEEFLRILEAKDRHDISSESGDKSTRRPSADPKDERRSSEKHSRGRSRSRGKSRGRSRGKSRERSRERSRGKSRGRSRGKSRGKSQARSRGRSRGQSRSRSRGKSCTRAKSQPRHRSRSRGRSFTRSESQPRLPKGSQEEAPASVRGTVSDLFQNLKQVLQSRELSVVKNTVMINQTESPEAARAAHSMLPHERVGGADRALSWISSWNDPGQKNEAFQNKPVFSSIEDEEEFLYGDEEGRKKPQAVTVPLAQTRPAENPTSSPCLSKPPVLQEHKGQAVTSTRPTNLDMSAENCERLKNLLNNIRLNLSPADISNLVTRLKQKQEEQRGAISNTSLRATLETTLKHHKVQESDERRGVRSESSLSHRDKKSEEKEKEQREKQIQKKRKEYLVKELEGLLKHEGSGDLIPVIGFFCQRCEEFFGDLRSAEGHKHTTTPPVYTPNTNTTNTAQILDQHLKEDKRQRDQKATERRDQDERIGERKRPREHTSPHRDEDQSRVQDPKDDDAQSSKKAKKKKKKEKKMKKKEKKKEKKKDKAEKE